jgi:hypothetical protein
LRPGGRDVVGEVQPDPHMVNFPVLEERQWRRNLTWSSAWGTG